MTTQVKTAKHNICECIDLLLWDILVLAFMSTPYSMIDFLSYAVHELHTSPILALDF